MTVQLALRFLGLLALAKEHRKCCAVGPASNPDWTAENLPLPSAAPQALTKPQLVHAAPTLAVAARTTNRLGLP